MNKSLRRTAFAILFSILFICVLFFSGQAFIKGKNSTAVAASDVNKITITTPSNAILIGTTFDLKVTFSSNVKGAVWAGYQGYIVPLTDDGKIDRDIIAALEVESHTNSYVSTAFTDLTPDRIDNVTSSNTSGFKIDASATGTPEIPSETDITVTAKFKVNDSFPSGASSIKFGLYITSKNPNGGISLYTNGFQNGSATQYKVRDSATIVETLTVNVSAQNSDADLASIKAGANASSLAVLSSSLTGANSAAAANAVEYKTGSATYTNDLFQFDLKDNSKGGTITVTSGSTSKTFTDGTAATFLPNNALASGSCDLEIKVVSQDGSKTLYYKITVKSSFAALGGSTAVTTDYSAPAAVANVTTTAPTKNGLAAAISPTSTSNDITINVPSSAKTINFKPVVANGYGINTSVIGFQRVSGSNFKINNSSAMVSVANNAEVKITSASSSVGFTDGDKFSIVIAPFTGGTDARTYTVTINVFEDDATLNDTTVNLTNGTRDTTKTSAYYYFTFDSPSNTKGNLSATATKNTATVKIGSGSATAGSATASNLGAGNYNIVVTAPAGNTRTYSVTVEGASVVADFDKIEISLDGGNSYSILVLDTTTPPGTFSPDYTAATKTFEKTLTPNDLISTATKIFFRVSPKGGGAGITVTGGTGLGAYNAVTKTLSGDIKFGNNSYTITAKETSGTGTNTYTFNIKLSEDKYAINNLELSNNGTAINGSTTGVTDYTPYNKDNTSYTLSVPNGISSIDLTFTTDGVYTVVEIVKGSAKANASHTADSNTHTYTWSLNEGENVITFQAKADEGATGANVGAVYTYKITRAGKSSNKKLDELTVTIGGVVQTLSPAFNPDDVTTGTYTITYDGDATLVDIKATPNDNKTTVNGTGNKQLDLTGGTATFPLTITAEDGSTRTINIKISSTPYVPDDNYEIASISITGSDQNEYFNSTDTPLSGASQVFEFTVPFDVTNVSAFVTAVSNLSIINGGGQHALNVGLNVVEVYAVSESNKNNDGSLLKYTFNITREEPVAEVLLSNLLINGIPVASFAPHTTDYKVGFDVNTTSVALSATAELEDAEIVVQVGTMQLGAGTGSVSGVMVALGQQGSETRVVITVSKNGVSTNYVVDISRASARPILINLKLDKYNIYTDIEQNEADLIDTMDEATMRAYANSHTDVICLYTSVEYEDQYLHFDLKADDNTAIIRNLINNHEIIGGDNISFSIEEVLGDNAFGHVNFTVLSPTVTSGATHYCVYITRLPAKNSNTDAEIYFDEEEMLGFNDAYAEDRGDSIVYDTEDAPFYMYTVPYDSDELTITVNLIQTSELMAVGTFEVINNGKIVITGKANGSSNKFDVAYGVNVVKVVIRASDGVTKKVIAILITREEAEFTNIKIDEIPDFEYDYKADKTQTNFTYSVPNKVSKLTLNIEVDEDFGYTYNVLGNYQKLEKGLNTIYIFLYEEDGGRVSVAAYSAAANNVPSQQYLKRLALNVYREPNDTSLVWTVFFFIFLVLALIELVLLILMITKKNKEENETVIVNNTPAPAAQPAPQAAPQSYYQPVVQPMPVQPIVQQLPMQPIVQPMPVQPIVQQLPPVQQQYVDPNAGKQQNGNQPPVNVEVKITGMGDNDGFYDNYGGNGTNRR